MVTIIYICVRRIKIVVCLDCVQTINRLKLLTKTHYVQVPSCNTILINGKLAHKPISIIYPSSYKILMERRATLLRFANMNCILCGGVSTIINVILFLFLHFKIRMHANGGQHPFSYMWQVGFIERIKCPCIPWVLEWPAHVTRVYVASRSTLAMRM